MPDWLAVAAKPMLSGEMRNFDAAQEGETVEWMEVAATNLMRCTALASF